MKIFKIFLMILPVAILIVMIILELMSHGAAATFNLAMTKQNMLKGTINVNTLTATPTGKVSFEHLIWKDTQGVSIVEIEEGSFKVRLWDIITRHLKSTTIQELTLTKADISLHLDDNMQVDFVRHSSDFNEVNQQMKTDNNNWEQKISRVNKTEAELKAIGENRRRLQQLKIEKGWKNFNTDDKKIHLKLSLKNCQIEVFYKDRHFMLKNVNVNANIDTSKSLTLDAHTADFGGTMIGRGAELHGKIDFATDSVPRINLSFMFKDVDPSSLGFGMNIHDQMTLTAMFTGNITRPVADGKLNMRELNLPGLKFTNVEGEVHYEDSTIDFKNVSADVYGGRLSAYGDYNMDTRYYNIYGYIDKLKTYSALPKSHLHCNVNLDLVITSKGNTKETYTGGVFTSDKGRYSFVRFNEISGKFATGYRDIHFFDVIIDMGSYKIATDALSIVDKKLQLTPINISDENGALFKSYDLSR